MAKTVNSIRWSAFKASAEFGIDRLALTKAIKQNSIEPGKDGKFSTKQICNAVFGDIDSERLRLTREQADKIFLDNQKRKGELIERRAVRDFIGKVFVNIRQRITASHLIEEEKDEMLLDLKVLGQSEWAKKADEPIDV